MASPAQRTRRHARTPTTTCLVWGHRVAEPLAARLSVTTPFGNVDKSASGHAGVSFQASYLTTNRINSYPGQAASYDSNGDLTLDNLGNAFTWNTYGGLLTATPSGGTTSTATYDAFGRMVELAVGSTYYQSVYAPGFKDPVASTTGMSLNYATLPLPGGAQAVYGPSGLTSYIHGDWISSGRLSSDPNQNVLDNGAYAPFGESYANGPSSTGNVNFSGEYQNTVAGVYDFLMRRYSPSQGRWLSPDPAGLAAVDPTNPQSWNRYAYVVNNPLALVDPFGLQHCVDWSGCAMGNLDSDGSDPAGEFQYFDTVASPWGIYSYLPGVWDIAMQDGYGGGITDGPDDELLNSNNEIVGYTFLTFSPGGPGSDVSQMLDGSVTSGPTIARPKSLFQRLASSLCGGGSFVFSGVEGDFAVVDVFSGAIEETDSEGNTTVGTLSGFGGGEVVQGGVGYIAAPNGAGGPFTYAGLGAHFVIAGGGVGVVGGQGWLGGYAEGHAGGFAGGAGFYVNTSCAGR